MLCAMRVDAESGGRALAAKFEALLPHLDERTRRLVLGAEARSLGHGGITMVAKAAGVSRATVTAGVDELESGQDLPGRVRRRGGGRKPLTDSDSGLVDALDGLVDPESRGDPMSRLRWTTRSTRTLARELTDMGHKVSHHTVAALLTGTLGYILQSNVKTMEGTQHPDRNAQFHYINSQVTQHICASQPVISVDAKKKELIGDYANSGTVWRPAGQPRQVNSHDFPGPDGKAVPYGVYDVATDTGWVSVGCDGDTAQFAVSTIDRWWTRVGTHAYPGASRLLICADAGGSNGYRLRLWKRELAAFAQSSGLSITVTHMPPGTSKWNKIEHRLFSQITRNWAGQPLTSHDVAVNLIGGTTTTRGLTVHAERDTDTYPRGIKISDKEMKQLLTDHVDAHTFHGEWNYTITPTPNIK